MNSNKYSILLVSDSGNGLWWLFIFLPQFWRSVGQWGYARFLFCICVGIVCVTKSLTSKSHEIPSVANTTDRKKQGLPHKMKHCHRCSLSHKWCKCFCNECSHISLTVIGYVGLGSPSSYPWCQTCLKLIRATGRCGPLVRTPWEVPEGGNRIDFQSLNIL